MTDPGDEQPLNNDERDEYDRALLAVFDIDVATLPLGTLVRAMQTIATMLIRTQQGGHRWVVWLSADVLGRPTGRPVTIDDAAARLNAMEAELNKRSTPKRFKPCLAEYDGSRCNQPLGHDGWHAEHLDHEGRGRSWPPNKGRP